MPSTRRAASRLLCQSSVISNDGEKDDRRNPQRGTNDGHTTNTSRTVEDRTRSIKGAGMLPMSSETRSPSTCSEEVEKQKDMARDGVNEAIEGLAKMEMRLQRAVKRQKLKIEASTIPPKGDPHPRVFKPRIPKVKPKSGNEGAKSDPLPTPERDAQDSDYEEDAATNEATPEVAERGAARPPPVNSDFLPLPWKGRLGYACLNTYLRAAKQPVFCSRTCRMASIIDHRHPLQDPSQPEHPTKNRPDRTKKANVALGQKFVQGLGLTNARDIAKMLRWNDRYGIKFMRLSSEMFPFASHVEHGYKLAPFASEVLAEAGKVAAELGHRLTVHPGQFTQLGSPRKEVVEAAIRDLEYHDEMLTLLRLPPQQNRDAVMILHMGGIFGDKTATLARFKENYTRLSASIKARLVLENDDVGWNVHDLLPVCEDLNIPLVLDYHHHNICFDPEKLREGTEDISAPELMARITATWMRKNITQKMHYSEPCAGAVTPRDRRKHSPRVATLPPCPPTMDLMIEAKDKEQAVFELMRTFKLPGFDLIHDVVPHEREDESREPVRKKKPKSAKGRGKKKDMADEEVDEGSNDYEIVKEGMEVPEEERSMGGPERRVYWPPGMEDWLKPKKRDQTIKRKADDFDVDL